MMLFNSDSGPHIHLQNQVLHTFLPLQLSAVCWRASYAVTAQQVHLKYKCLTTWTGLVA